MMTTLRGIFNNKELILFLPETAATTKIEILNKEDTLLQQGLYTAARYQRTPPFTSSIPPACPPAAGH